MEKSKKSQRNQANKKQEKPTPSKMSLSDETKVNNKQWKVLKQFAMKKDYKE